MAAWVETRVDTHKLFEEALASAMDPQGQASTTSVDAKTLFEEALKVAMEPPVQPLAPVQRQQKARRTKKVQPANLPNSISPPTNLLPCSVLGKLLEAINKQ